MVVVRGVGLLLMAAIGGGLWWGGLDALVRWHDGFSRLAQSVLWLTGIGAAGWLGLWRPLRHRLSDLDLAKRIHRRWPALTPDLVSGVEFSEQSVTPEAGAPLLQHIAISRARAQLATVPVGSLLDPRRVVRPVLGLVVCLAALIGCGVWQPAWLGIGTVRLLQPWSAWDWPRRTTLVYLDAELQPIRETALRTPLGENFTVYLENQLGSLPGTVRFVRQAPDGASVEQGILSQATLRDREGRPHSVAVATWAATAACEFRATGGDDDRSPWLRISVVQPPRIETFTITVTPPVYTGRPTEVTESTVGHLQGLVGSRVEVRAKTNSPLTTAILNRGQAPPQSLTPNATDLNVPFALTIASEERDSYWLALTDREGIAAVRPPRYEIRGVRDEDPVVTLTEPDSDQRVTPTAVVALKGLARDDIGLKRVGLFAEFPDAVAISVPASAPATRELPLGPATVGDREQAIDFTWDLTDLQLQPGMAVRFWVQAVDAFDLNGSTGQVGKSATRVLSIVSPDEKQQELSGRQRELAERVDALREKQAALAQSAREVRDQWTTVGALRPEDRRDLERVETGQRELEQQLTDPQRGLLAELKSLRAELTSNRLGAEPEASQLAGWEATLEPLATEVMPPIPQLLEAVRQATAPGLPKPASREQLAGQLDQAVTAQQRALGDLTHLTEEMAQWRQAEDVTRRVAELTTRQTELREQSVRLGQTTMTKSYDELSTQDLADLARASDRQAGLAQEVDQLAKQLQAAPGHAALAKKLDDQSIASRMREASDELRKNHVQSATTAQRELLDALDSLREDLALDRSRSARSEVEELRKAVTATSELRKRQAKLRKQTQALSNPSADPQRAAEVDELQRLQREAAEQATELAERLRRETRDQAAQAMKRATDRMQAASEELENESMEPASANQQAALDDLDQAADDLQDELTQAEQQAEEQALTAITQLVTALLERQRAARDETIRLQEIRLTEGKWTRSQLKSLQQLTETQTELADSSAPIITEPDTLRIVALCLRTVVAHQRSAAKRLTEREAGEPTQGDQLAAEKLMEQFLASVAAPPMGGDEGPMPPSEGEPPGEPPQPGGAASTIAVELRLMLSMQEDLQQRTRELVDLRQAGHALNDQQKAELETLRGQQKELAASARGLLEQASEELLP